GAPRAHGLADRHLDEVCGADRDCRFLDHYLVAINVVADGLGDAEDIGQICRSILTRRCADSDENEVGKTDADRRIGRKAQASSLGIAGHEFLQPRLEYRDLAVSEV